MPYKRVTNNALFSTRGATFDLDRVHHLTVPVGEHGLKEAVMTGARDANPGEDPHEQAEGFARLVNYKPLWCNSYSETVYENDFLGKSSSTLRDTLRGAFDEFEYALVERDEDCDVHLRLKEGAVISPCVFRNTFSALLRAVAFVHGQHAWPQWERVKTDSRVLHELASAPCSPHMRGRMDAGPSYAPRVELNEVMVGRSVCEVIESNLQEFGPGDIVVA
jgi:hypothetical protein